MTVGSDDYPIIEVGLSLEEYDRVGLQKRSFNSPDWEIFSDQEVQKNDINEDVDNWNVSVCRYFRVYSKEWM